MGRKHPNIQNDSTPGGNSDWAVPRTVHHNLLFSALHNVFIGYPDRNGFHLSFIGSRGSLAQSVWCGLWFHFVDFGFHFVAASKSFSTSLIPGSCIATDFKASEFQRRRTPQPRIATATPCFFSTPIIAFTAHHVRPNSFPISSHVAFSSRRRIKYSTSP